MRINCAFLGIVSTILVLSVGNVSIFEQNVVANASSADVEVASNGTAFKLSREYINTLNFSCDIELNCFDKKIKSNL